MNTEINAMMEEYRADLEEEEADNLKKIAGNMLVDVLSAIDSLKKQAEQRVEESVEVYGVMLLSEMAKTEIKQMLNK